MTELVDVIVKVSPQNAEILKKVKNAELVIRDLEKRYKPFIDCIVTNAPDIDKANLNNLLMPAVQLPLKNTQAEYAIHLMKNTLKQINIDNKTLKDVSDSLKKLTLDTNRIFKSFDVVNKIGCLNIALNGMNLASTIVGCVIIKKQLNDLESKIDGLSKKIDQLKDNELNKINADFHKLVINFNSIATKLRDHDPVNRDQLEAYLRDTNSFISDRLIGSILKSTFDTDDMLSMINALLPSYTLILQYFQMDYFYDKHRIHDNYSTFANLYNELLSDELMKKINDYVFLEKKMSSYDALVATTVEKILVNDQLIQLLSRMEIIKEFSDREQLDEYDNAVNESVKEVILKRVEEKSAEENVDYSNIIPLINQAYQTLQV